MRMNLQHSNFIGKKGKKKCWELVQLTILTFKAVILTVAAIVLEPAEFSVSATAEHAVFSQTGG